MDYIVDIFTNPTLKDVSFAAFTAFIILRLLTGKLIPFGTHKREMDDLRAWGEGWHQAHTVSETARGELAQENFKQAETIRLAGIKPVTPEHSGGG